MRGEKDPVTGMEAAEVGEERPSPDPEVVAKPTRRQFTAEYRLRIVEEADRCADSSAK